MDTKRPHSLKSTESSSYEIIYSILDNIDSINEANSKIDQGRGNERLLLETVFKSLENMTVELRSLVRFWTLYKEDFERSEKKENSASTQGS